MPRKEAKEMIQIGSHTKKRLKRHAEKHGLYLFQLLNRIVKEFLDKFEDK